MATKTPEQLYQEFVELHKKKQLKSPIPTFKQWYETVYKNISPKKYQPIQDIRDDIEKEIDRLIEEVQHIEVTTKDIKKIIDSESKETNTNKENKLYNQADLVRYTGAHKNTIKIIIDKLQLTHISQNNKSKFYSQEQADLIKEEYLKNHKDKPGISHRLIIPKDHLTQKQISEKYNISPAVLSKIIKDNNIRPDQKEHKCHFYHQKTVDKIVNIYRFQIVNSQNKKDLVTISELSLIFSCSPMKMRLTLSKLGIRPVIQQKNKSYYDKSIINILEKEFKMRNKSLPNDVPKDKVITTKQLVKELEVSMSYFYNEFSIKNVKYY